MSRLITADQIKALRADIKELKHHWTWKHLSAPDVEGRLKALSTDISEIKTDTSHLRSRIDILTKEFNDLDNKLFQWKSELFNKIDEGYISRWKDQTEEHAAIQFRLNEHQEDIDKIKTKISITP